MKDYTERDSFIKKFREEKMEVAENITGTGYHEMLKEFHDLGYRQNKMVSIINKAAGKTIVTHGGIHASLVSIRIFANDKKHSHTNRLTPRHKKLKAVPTGIIRPCLKCGEDFRQTNVNHATCMNCFSVAKDATEYY